MRVARRFALHSLSLMVLVGAAAVPAAAQEGNLWTFDSIDRIEIDGTSGDLEIVTGSGSSLTLRLEEDVRPVGGFRPEVDRSGGTLRIREDWGRGNSRGRVRWTLEIPASMRPAVRMDSASGGVRASGVTARFAVDTASGSFALRDGTLMADSEIDTASGDLELVGVTVEDSVDMSTASGNIEIDGVRAGRDFEFSTASGNVRIRDSRGVLDGSTASGSVTVETDALDGAAHFSSASGHVHARIGSPIREDLHLSSASGDVELTVAGFGDAFTLVMVVRQDRGRIDSPFDFTSQETFQRNGRTYERRTVRRGTGGPEILLETATGDVIVRALN